MAGFKKYGWVTVGIVLLLLFGLVLGAGYETYSLGTVSFSPERPVGDAITPWHSDCRVAILRSDYTSKFFKSPANYDAHIEYWHSLVMRLNLPYEIINDQRLELGIEGFRILILPSAICLSEKEEAGIRDFASKGGGVICTWATGARDEKGDWKGLEFAQSLTGADTLDFTERTSPWYVSLSSYNPLTAGAPSGARIQVDSPERLEAKALQVDGYWSDARLFPVDANLPVNFQGALIHNTLGQGRIAWLGFQENSAVAGDDNKTILDSVLINALAWAGHRTLCAVNPWPAPYVAASVFACDVEEKYSNASYAASALRKARETGTFFCLSDSVKEDADLLPQLVGAGEVASHGDSHVSLGKAGPLAQFIRIARSKWRLHQLGGTWVKGFHPPSDDFSENTLRALAAARFQYILIGGEYSSSANSVLPDVVRISQTSRWFHRERELVRLTRTIEDDLHFSPLGMVGLDPGWITERALSDFEIIHGLGGLYIFSYHSQGFSAPEYVGVIPNLIDKYHQTGTWIATAESVANWWESRRHVSFALNELTDGGVRLTVTHGGTNSLDSLAVAVYPPGQSGQLQVASAGAPKTSVEVVPYPDLNLTTLKLGRLEPGKTYVFDLHWGQ